MKVALFKTIIPFFVIYLFIASHDIAETQSQTSKIKISAVGDIMLGGTAGPEMEIYGYDYPFAVTKGFFVDSDIVFGNLEGPLTDRGEPVTAKEYIFRSPPAKVAPALAKAGFNIFSIANNHILDYGQQGLKDTIDALTEAGIAHVGAGNTLKEARSAAILDKNGVKVAFLAYSLTFPKEFWATPVSPGTAFGHKKHVKADVKKALQKSDIVIVSFHWGRATTKIRDYQPELGRAAIDAGASVVLGHHSHLLQGIELYKDGIIIYSLGNFTFGSFSRTATRSAIAQIEFEDKKFKKLAMIPVDVNNVEVVFQPKPLDIKEAVKVVEELQRLSQPFGTDVAFLDGRGIVFGVK